MSKLTKIIVIIAKNLAESLLRIAQEVSTLDDRAIIANSDPTSTEFIVGISVLFEIKRRRYWAEILEIEGETLKVENKAVGKTWTIHTSQVEKRSDYAYEIDRD